MSLREFHVSIVKSLIEKGEIFAAQVACYDWRLSYDKIVRELENGRQESRSIDGRA